MNMSHTVVSRGETNEKIAACGDQHLRKVAITLLANAFRFILWCWDNFRRSWRQSQWGAVCTVCIAGPTGIGANKMNSQVISWSAVVYAPTLWATALSSASGLSLHGGWLAACWLRDARCC